MQQDFDISYNNLNSSQKQAVDKIDGPVMVLAGPGTGKTQLLATRVANILKLTDTLPSSILCLTFTDSASLNMKQRLASMIGRDAYKVAIHTFHSFGTEVINHNPESFFFGADFKPADPLAQYSILKQIFESLSFDNPLKSYHKDHDYTYLKDSNSIISALKNGGVTPEDFSKILSTNEHFIKATENIFADLFSEKISSASINKITQIYTQIEAEFSENLPVFGSPQPLSQCILESIEKMLIEIDKITESRSKTKPLTSWKNKYFAKDFSDKLVLKDSKNLDKHLALADIYTKYQEELFKLGLFDFNDMLLQVVQAFENPKMVDLKYNYQEKYQYVLVDEFQDTNGIQTRLLENLLNSNNHQNEPNIMTVGDDDQAVFKFQGANLQNIFDFKKSYSTAQVINLSDNYRSTQDILDLASEVISQSTNRLSHLLDIDKKLISKTQKYD